MTEDEEIIEMINNIRLYCGKFVDDCAECRFCIMRSQGIKVCQLLSLCIEMKSAPRDWEMSKIKEIIRWKE